MKIDRFASASIRTAILLAGLVMAAGLLAACHHEDETSSVAEELAPQVGEVQSHHEDETSIVDPVPTPPVGDTDVDREDETSRVAEELAPQVGEVQKKFDENRRALRTVPTGSNQRGMPVYTRQEVAGLITGTEKDLDQAIDQFRESGLEALRAWSAEEFRRIQEELAASADHTSASSPRLATRQAAAPQEEQEETVSAEKTNQLLDRVKEVVDQIFRLAADGDLVVSLWVGSPTSKVTFSFWPQGTAKGSTSAPTIIRTNGEKDRVPRGLYSYRAVWSQGAATQLIEYPIATGAQQSQRLDLVTDSGFFCCRFEEQVCEHVTSAKECH